MDKKRIYICIIVIVLVLIVGMTTFFIVQSNKKPGEKIVIEQHDYSQNSSESKLSTVVKEIELVNKKDVNQFNELYEKLTEPKEEVNITIFNDIIIKLENGTEIYIDNYVKDYCVVKNMETKETKFMNMTSEFLKYVRESLEKE